MLEIRNYSTYRIALGTEGGQPAHIDLEPSSGVQIMEQQLKLWSGSVKQDLAAYVDKGVLVVHDMIGAVDLTPVAILTY